MSQNRKSLKTKMSQTFFQEIKGLPRETQEILIDDLVTAFENRLLVFNKKQPVLEFEVADRLEVSQ